jgi:hypothetical protein
MSQKLEKHGWLNYKLVSSSSTDTSKDKNTYKRRYFHLRACTSPDSSRSNSVDNRASAQAQNATKQTANYPTNRIVYMLECFKEVPGMRKNENPKHQVFFDHTEVQLKNTSNRNGSILSFEIIEHKSDATSEATHLFTVDSQKQFEEWFSILETVVFCNSNKFGRGVQKSTPLSLLSSPSTASSSHNTTSSMASPVSELSSTSNFSALSLAKEGNFMVSIAKSEDLNSNSLNESVESHENVPVLAKAPVYRVTKPLQSNSSEKFLNTFDLNKVNSFEQKTQILNLIFKIMFIFKYLNENEEDLLVDKTENSKAASDALYNQIQQVNTFDLYQKQDTAVDEETELECVYPEKSNSRKLLLTCVQLKMNLYLPYVSFNTMQQKSGPTTSGPRLSSLTLKSDSTSFQSVNPELFYLQFALYDARSCQKISANFDWIPNSEAYLNQLCRSTTLTANLSGSKSFNGGGAVLNNSSQNGAASNGGRKRSLANVFSLDGKSFAENPLSILKSECKKSLLNQLSKVQYFIQLRVFDLKKN